MAIPSDHLWFTSDTHFGHGGIVKLSHRPFNSLQEMERTIMRNINRVVPPEDHLYILGDFSNRIDLDEARRWVARIACENIHFIRGNHDLDGLFPDARDYDEIRLRGGHKAVLFHYPIAEWNGFFHKAIHLHGHIHSEGPAYNERNRSRGYLRYDVGVDANGFAPVSMAAIEAFFGDLLHDKTPLRSVAELDMDDPRLFGQEKDPALRRRDAEGPEGGAEPAAEQGVQMPIEPPGTPS